MKVFWAYFAMGVASPAIITIVGRSIGLELFDLGYVAGAVSGISGLLAGQSLARRGAA